MDISKEDDTAIRLSLALKTLRARLREDSLRTTGGLSITQLSILHNLEKNGPSTAAGLAITEHISQQAIAQNITPLKAEGLLTTNPDPDDGRKAVITITAAGRRLRHQIVASRHSWLRQAIESSLTIHEQHALKELVSLLEILADADPYAGSSV